jgi:hypothetical protein
MKHALALAAVLLGGQQPLAVTSPNGGERWPRGSRQEITWTVQGEPTGRVKIELYEGPNWRRTLASSAPNDGTHRWDLPADLRPGTDYRIRITSTTDAAVTDSSDAAFSITAPSLTVTSPDGGETWPCGSRQEITWDAADDPGDHVKIELYEGSNWRRTLASSVPNDGTHAWMIPADLRPGTDYRIRITSTANPAYTDESDGPFAITAAAAPARLDRANRPGAWQTRTV